MFGMHLKLCGKDFFHKENDAIALTKQLINANIKKRYHKTQKFSTFKERKKEKGDEKEKGIVMAFSACGVFGRSIAVVV